MLLFIQHLEERHANRFHWYASCIRVMFKNNDMLALKRFMFCILNKFGYS